MKTHSNTHPRLHNAMWPGLVGKGSPGAEPFIDLDTMLELTAGAQVDGVRFEGVDLFLYDPHVNIDATNDDLKRIAEKIESRGFVVGSVVAPVWPPTGGGAAMGTPEERKQFVTQVLKACRIARKLRDLGIRPYGVVRIDSAASPADWAKDPEGNQKLIAQTFREACDVAKDFGEKLAAEGEVCWAGMHSWKRMVQLLEMVDRPNIGFQADMAHTLLYTMGVNQPEDAILPQNWNWSDPKKFDDALRKLTAALRPWTIDFHVAQNDATVKGSGSHDKTGRHCLPDDPNGKLNIAHHAGFWLRDEKGKPTRKFQHMCWDGCMFPNAVMQQQETWNHILAAMVAVRDAHGWTEAAAGDEDAPIPFEQIPEPFPKPGGQSPAQPATRPAAPRAPEPAAPRAPQPAEQRAPQPALQTWTRKPAKKAKARKPARARVKKSRLAAKRRKAKPAKRGKAKTSRRAAPKAKKRTAKRRRPAARKKARR